MYELLYIVPAPYTEKDLGRISQKVKKIISDLGGEVTQEKNLGGKKLAYPIKHIYRGFYLLLQFKLSTEKINQLNQKLKLTPEILRSMITKAIKVKPRPEKRVKQKEAELSDIFEKKEEPALAPDSFAAETEIKKDKEEEKEEEKKPKKPKKFDLKRLGDKIDELLKT